MALTFYSEMFGKRIAIFTIHTVAEKGKRPQKHAKKLTLAEAL